MDQLACLYYHDGKHDFIMRLPCDSINNNNSDGFHLLSEY